MNFYIFYQILRANFYNVSTAEIIVNKTIFLALENSFGIAEVVECCFCYKFWPHLQMPLPVIQRKLFCEVQQPTLYSRYNLHFNTDKNNWEKSWAVPSPEQVSLVYWRLPPSEAPKCLAEPAIDHDLQARE